MSEKLCALASTNCFATAESLLNISTCFATNHPKSFKSIKHYLRTFPRSRLGEEDSFLCVFRLYHSPNEYKMSVGHAWTILRPYRFPYLLLIHSYQGRWTQKTLRLEWEQFRRMLSALLEAEQAVRIRSLSQLKKSRKTLDKLLHVECGLPFQLPPRNGLSFRLDRISLHPQWTIHFGVKEIHNTRPTSSKIQIVRGFALLGLILFWYVGFYIAFF